MGEHYARIRIRLTGLLEDATDDEWARPVQACPGWRVHDVLSHLVGTVEDALAGRLTGPPTEELTAEQVARHRPSDPRDLLAAWTTAAPAFEEVLSGFEIWPGAIDVLSHEQDVRHALDRPGGRDDPLFAVVAEMLLRRLDGRLALTAVVDGEPVEVQGPGAPLGLRTTAFEVVRATLGRRSVDQVCALDWTGDPAAAMDCFFVFGVATDALVE